jgi:hypothetical protein
MASCAAARETDGRLVIGGAIFRRRGRIHPTPWGDALGRVWEVPRLGCVSIDGPSKKLLRKPSAKRSRAAERGHLGKVFSLGHL